MPKLRERRQQSAKGSDAPDFDHGVLEVRRTARVVAGGRRFSFRAVVVAGNRRGSVGVGMGKGADTATAVQKAVFHAKKNTISIPLTNDQSISGEVSAKFSAAEVLLRGTRQGGGLRAGGPVRMIAELAGIRNLTAKIRGRTVNKLNNARATIEALKKLKSEARSVKNTISNGSRGSRDPKPETNSNDPALSVTEHADPSIETKT